MIVLLAVLAASTVGCGESRQGPEREGPGNPAAAAERVRALEERLRTLEERLNDDYRKLQELPGEEQERAASNLFAEHRERMKELGADLLAIARAAPSEPIALEAIRVALDANLEREALVAALAILEEHHARGDAVAEVLPRLAGYGDKSVDRLLKSVLERNPSSHSQAVACFQLAMRTRDESAREELLERVAGELTASDPRDESLRAHAEHALFALRNLKIGMKAPEISGTDMDGAAMTLSEHRGKVVILDFWGYW